jgi:DUF971 family protein
MTAAPWPTELVFKRAERALTIAFDDGARFAIPFELLRVESPSAEVRGHGGEKKLVSGKRNVDVRDALPVGRYAVRIVFDDGHETGIYSWAFLRELGANQTALMAQYEAQLQAAGKQR